MTLIRVNANPKVLLELTIGRLPLYFEIQMLVMLQLWAFLTVFLGMYVKEM
jgi:hypothetical protein